MRAGRIRAVATAAAFLLVMAGSGAMARAAAPDAALVEQGRRIYVEGRLPDGSALRATRGVVAFQGKDAACIACHRRSGLGTTEGEVIVPPVSGRALRAGPKLQQRAVVMQDPRRGRAFNPAHEPYDDAALLKALREGVHVSGRTMLPLMPRYEIEGGAFRALVAYLDQLSSAPSPGIGDDVVHLATVITPGVDARRKAAFLQTLRTVLEQKNVNTLPGHRHMSNAAEMIMRLERHWTLDVWELQGAPATWGEQLRARQAASPVFALVSGLGDGEWSPVQQFCEGEQVPCWFPSVALTPAGVDDQTYGLYFSGGVRVEAQALATTLAAKGRKPSRVIQVLREGAAAEAAAAELQQHLPDVTIEQRRLDGTGAAALSKAMAGTRSGDVLVLWLGPEDLQSLASLPAPANDVYLSARLATGLMPAVPAAWQPRTRVIYPYELGNLRDLNIATFRSWLEIRSLPVVDEAMQCEVYFAMSYLQYTLSEMLDNPYRDYLIDRGESMLLRRELARAEEETLLRQQAHPPARKVVESAPLAPGTLYGRDPNGPLARRNNVAIGVRQGTTIYPRLSLAANQRQASKGAYIARFGAEGALVAEGGWVVP